MKKVSVIIPIYKGNRYISKLLHMLEDNWKFANQLYNVEIEAILVNDYPVERLKLEEGLPENISCLLIENEQNRGIHFSRIEGVRQSKGDYILFLDQDDEISPIYIKAQLEALGDCDVIICNGKNHSRLIYANEEELHKVVDCEEYKKGRNRISSPGQVLLRREIIPTEWLDNVVNRNGADDYFLWILLFYQGCRVVIQDKILYWHVTSDNNTSSDISEMDKSVFEVAEKLRYLGYWTYEEEMRIKDSRARRNIEEISIEGFQKTKKYKDILEFWMILRDRKISVNKYLHKQGMYKIVIYGAGILGKHLYYELRESDVQVICFLNQSRKGAIDGKRCLIIGEPIEPADAIIITPFMEYKEIKKELERYYSCAMISIETVLNNADCELMGDEGTPECETGDASIFGGRVRWLR